MNEGCEQGYTRVLSMSDLIRVELGLEKNLCAERPWLFSNLELALANDLYIADIPGFE